jgi:hypothetical protein
MTLVSQVKDFMDRRLQTLVLKKGHAKVTDAPMRSLIRLRISRDCASPSSYLF